MNGQQYFRPKFKSRQQGAVAIIVALSLVALVGMLGFVLDLGHLYVAKTELQNAADAAALGGAKQLNRTAKGIQNAVDKAMKAASKNNYDLNAKSVIISEDNIQFSSNQNGPWVDAGAAEAIADEIYFVKVDTGSDIQNPEILSTWFIHVLPGMSNVMRASAMAVAGVQVANVAPIGICAIDPVTPGDGVNTYYGFDKGIAYNLASINDLLVGLGKGTPLWLHPTAQSLDSCKNDVNFASRASFSPFLCLGKSAIGTSGSVYVYANTGWEAAQEGAINSRFRAPGESNDAQFSGMSAEICPPDANIKEYASASVSGPSCTPVVCNPASCDNKNCNEDKKAGTCTPKTSPPAGCTSDVDWLTYTPTQQSATLTLGNGVISDTPGDSVIASYIKPVDQSRIKTGTGYPDPSPYKYGIENHASTKYYAPPYTGTGVQPTEGRRMINVVVINCSSAGSPAGVCAELPKLGVAQFFMPAKAIQNGSNRGIYLEFVRRTLTLEDLEVKLYK